MEDGPTSELTFGAQVNQDAINTDKRVNYYAVAHRMSEKTSKQPAYAHRRVFEGLSAEGLQWMVSLYNNRLNGIPADEMVCDISQRCDVNQP